MCYVSQVLEIVTAISGYNYYCSMWSGDGPRRGWGLVNPFTVICAMFLTGQNCFGTLVAVCDPALELHVSIYVWSLHEV